VLEDRFFTNFKKCVNRVLNDADAVDYRAFYPARVVKWQSSGIFPSGVVDVVFVSDDTARSATVLQSISGVPVVPPVPGQSFVPQVGSQCLVGWQGSDERFPYAWGWLGLGGVDSVTHVFKDVYTLDGQLLDVVGDIRYQHLRLGGISARPTVSVVPAVSSVVSNPAITGSDAFFKVSFTFSPSMTIPSLAPSVDVLNITWKKTFISTPIVFGGTKLTLKSVSTIDAKVTPVTAISSAGNIEDTILTADPE